MIPPPFIREPFLRARLQGSTVGSKLLPAGRLVRQSQPRRARASRFVQASCDVRGPFDSSKPAATLAA